MADDYKPKYVEIQLMGHIAHKGFQAGSLIGLLGVAPALALRAGAVTADLVTRGAAYGALGGVALSLVLGVGKRATMDREGVEDRVYRLHHNKSQGRVDALCSVGSTVGLAAAALLLHQGASGRHPPAINLLGGAAAGCVAGLIAHMATRPAEMATPNRMMDYLKD
ncbi:MAG: hypothetical protein J3K34DRAFT_433877 [Monoraphidium minutum]|nr:MAG: hypothetical protein J3K34DRAFT_433877 [Monoraphidium minutum]